MSRDASRSSVHTRSESTAVAEARTLDCLTAHALQVDGVWADAVVAGDWVEVRTRNSTYILAVLGEGAYQVTGGWFTARHDGPVRVRIMGCTWGGSAILRRVIAAPGMFLEFDNGVRTTRIRQVRLLRSRDERPH